MSTGIIFEEIQAAGNKKIRDFFRVMAAMFLVALIANFIIQKTEITELTKGFLAGFLIMALGVIFTGVRMVTQFRNDGIYVRYPPFQPRFIRFTWTEIRQIQVRKYNALAEYNGWGIKTGISGRSYTAGGDSGIQLELTDGSFMLIGTRKPDEIEKLLAERLA